MGLLSLSNYVPWKRISSWRCLACGRCCSQFTVVLRAYEYAQILQAFGPEVIDINSLGNPCLRRVGGRCVFQDSSGLCTLQPLGLKPVTCKLWPFAVRRGELEDKQEREAVFYHQGERYYIFVNSSCTGINKGDPDRLSSILHEIVEISLNPSLPQKHSTSKATPILVA